MGVGNFVKPDLQVEDYWRGIVLFGRNVASYKFALAAALLDLKPESGDLVRLEELAKPFSQHLRSHLARADKQGTSASSKFLDVCRKANADEVSENTLIESTARLGFVNVIDAFHRVAKSDVPRRFFLDERKENNGIKITDSFSELLEGNQVSNLGFENDARWRLVETAWEQNLPRSLVTVHYDLNEESLFVLDRTKKRKAVTGARKALSGYQKGHCFYCFSVLSLSSDIPPEVDHFFPHMLKQTELRVPLDGVWNLVLACRDCNRHKLARIPVLRLLERLNTRNEFLITSHHPLRETLMKQTGKSQNERHDFLQSVYRYAFTTLLHEWEPQEEGPSLF